LPEGLTWSLLRGSVEPQFGWYSAGFGRRQPAWALLGEGSVQGRTEFMTRIAFDRDLPAGNSTGASVASGRLASSSSHR
jgi:hypothetical protein